VTHSGVNYMVQQWAHLQPLYILYCHSDTMKMKIRWSFLIFHSIYSTINDLSMTFSEYWLTLQISHGKGSKHNLNSFGDLWWNIETTLLSTTFLDLEISIKDTKINTKTYQKPMNLYFYIPPYPRTQGFNGLIIGEILRYWYLNSDKDDFINITSLFIQRLNQRGHKFSNITPALQTAMIDNNRSNSPTDNVNNTLFIHWKHNPNYINRSTICTIYNNTLNGNDNFTKMRIAVSRPRNLRDVLCHTRLPDLQDCNVSDILTKTINNHNNT